MPLRTSAIWFFTSASVVDRSKYRRSKREPAAYDQNRAKKHRSLANASAKIQSPPPTSCRRRSPSARTLASMAAAASPMPPMTFASCPSITATASGRFQALSPNQSTANAAGITEIPCFLDPSKTINNLFSISCEGREGFFRTRVARRRAGAGHRFPPAGGSRGHSETLRKSSNGWSNTAWDFAGWL